MDKDNKDKYFEKEETVKNAHVLTGVLGTGFGLPDETEQQKSRIPDGGTGSYELKLYIKDQGSFSTRSDEWVDFSDRCNVKGKNTLVNLGSIEHVIESSKPNTFCTATQSLTLNNSDGFWDNPLQYELKTVNGNTAYFQTTSGGENYNWYRLECKITRKVAEGAFTREDDLGHFLIETLETDANSGEATMGLVGLEKKLIEADAEVVKNGKAWYENKTFRFLVEELLKSCYREVDNSGTVPIEVARENDNIDIATQDATDDVKVFTQYGKPQVDNDSGFTYSMCARIHKQTITIPSIGDTTITFSSSFGMPLEKDTILTIGNDNAKEKVKVLADYAAGVLTISISPIYKEHSGTVYAFRTIIYLGINKNSAGGSPALFVMDPDKKEYAELFNNGDLGIDEPIKKMWWYNNNTIIMISFLPNSINMLIDAKVIKILVDTTKAWNINTGMVKTSYDITNLFPGTFNYRKSQPIYDCLSYYGRSNEHKYYNYYGIGQFAEISLTNKFHRYGSRWLLDLLNFSYSSSTTTTGVNLLNCGENLSIPFKQKVQDKDFILTREYNTFLEKRKTDNSLKGSLADSTDMSSSYNYNKDELGKIEKNFYAARTPKLNNADALLAKNVASYNLATNYLAVQATATEIWIVKAPIPIVYAVLVFMPIIVVKIDGVIFGYFYYDYTSKSFTNLPETTNIYCCDPSNNMFFSAAIIFSATRNTFEEHSWDYFQNFLDDLFSFDIKTLNFVKGIRTYSDGNYTNTEIADLTTAGKVSIHPLLSFGENEFKLKYNFDTDSYEKIFTDNWYNNSLLVEWCNNNSDTRFVSWFGAHTDGATRLNFKIKDYNGNEKNVQTIILTSFDELTNTQAHTPNTISLAYGVSTYTFGNLREPIITFYTPYDWWGACRCFYNNGATIKSGNNAKVYTAFPYIVQIDEDWTSDYSNKQLKLAGAEIILEKDGEIFKSVINYITVTVGPPAVVNIYLTTNTSYVGDKTNITYTIKPCKMEHWASDEKNVTKSVGDINYSREYLSNIYYPRLWADENFYNLIEGSSASPFDKYDDQFTIAFTYGQKYCIDLLQDYGNGDYYLVYFINYDIDDNDITFQTMKINDGSVTLYDEIEYFQPVCIGSIYVAGVRYEALGGSFWKNDGILSTPSWSSPDNYSYYIIKSAYINNGILSVGQKWLSYNTNDDNSDSHGDYPTVHTYFFPIEFADGLSEIVDDIKSIVFRKDRLNDIESIEYGNYPWIPTVFSHEGKIANSSLRNDYIYLNNVNYIYQFKQPLHSLTLINPTYDTYEVLEGGQKYYWIFIVKDDYLMYEWNGAIRPFEGSYLKANIQFELVSSGASPVPNDLTELADIILIDTPYVELFGSSNYFMSYIEETQYPINTDYYWIWKLSADYGGFVTIADFTSLTAWDALSLLAEASNSEMGFDTNGNFYFIQRKLTINESDIVETFDNIENDNIIDIKKSLDYKRIYNTAEIATYVATIENPKITVFPIDSFDNIAISRVLPDTEAEQEGTKSERPKIEANQMTNERKTLVLVCTEVGEDSGVGNDSAYTSKWKYKEINDIIRLRTTVPIVGATSTIHINFLPYNKNGALMIKVDDTIFIGGTEKTITDIDESLLTITINSDITNKIVGSEVAIISQYDGKWKATGDGLSVGGGYTYSPHEYFLEVGEWYYGTTSAHEWYNEIGQRATSSYDYEAAIYDPSDTGQLYRINGRIVTALSFWWSERVTDNSERTIATLPYEYGNPDGQNFNTDRHRTFVELKFEFNSKRFKVGDRIEVVTQGLSLKRNEAYTETYTDYPSFILYGKREYIIDNRFIDSNLAKELAVKIVGQFKNPQYEIEITSLNDFNLKLHDIISVKHKRLFSSCEDYSVVLKIEKISYNTTTNEMEITGRTYKTNGF